MIQPSEEERTVLEKHQYVIYFVPKDEAQAERARLEAMNRVENVSYWQLEDYGRSARFKIQVPTREELLPDISRHP